MTLNNVYKEKLMPETLYTLLVHTELYMLKFYIPFSTIVIVNKLMGNVSRTIGKCNFHSFS